MDEHFLYNSITVTTLGEQNQVDFSLQRLEGDLKERVSLSVLIPLGQAQTLLEVQKAAAQRAIELLQKVLTYDPQQESE